MKMTGERKKEEETLLWATEETIPAEETWKLSVCVAMASDDAKSKGIRR